MKLHNPENCLLTKHILQEMNHAGGRISFARYMELALYTEGLGYYSSGLQKLGVEGDFVTAPEISPLFAQSVARQCQQILEELQEGDILELGAGTGVFAKDLLLELDKLTQKPRNYYIFEISADLRRRQREMIELHCPEWLSRVHWLEKMPDKFEGIILANEVMDALPVHCFRVENGFYQERSIMHDGQEFVWTLTEPSLELKEQLEAYLHDKSFADGYESEINLGLSAWIQSIANSLEKGVILLFDYGYGKDEYYHPDRHMGTLMCYSKHHKHANPLILQGNQDITAHVDFTRVVESAVANHCELAGYTTQAAFLLGCGILEIASQKNLPTLEQFQQNQAIKKLILPAEMGELVKVMALSKKWNAPLLGFSVSDRCRDL